MLDEKNDNLSNEVDNTSQEKDQENTMMNSEQVQENVSEAEVPTNAAVEEISEKLAEEAQDTEEKQEIEMQDYDAMSLEQLVDALEKLVKNHPVQMISKHVNAIKNSFNSKFGALLEEKKKQFLAEGGNIIDFHYSSPLKMNFNVAMGSYREKRDAHYQAIEKRLNDNLKLRLETIEELKNLVEEAHGEKNMFNDFQKIQEKWKSIGPVPKDKYNNTWQTYHFHVERFYDLLHISNDLRDLDFKHNLEEKRKLIEKAKGLSELDDINEAFKGLQELHRVWKEDIGPVSREHREEIWQEFSNITKGIHDKRHEYYKNLKQSFEENIDKKLEVIGKIKELASENPSSHSDWQENIQKLEALREDFFKIGSVPKARNEEIWNLFKEATRSFNHSKNLFYKNIKSEQQENLTKKLALIEEAVALKDSEDWQSTTEKLKKIQSDWKKIGHVPRKHSDKIWKDFKDACNHFFNRLRENQDEDNKKQLEVFNKKKEYLEKIKAEIAASEKITLDRAKEFINDWRTFGKVPQNLRHIDIKFNKVLDKVFNEISEDRNEFEMVKFRNLVDSYLEQNDTRKLNNEIMFVRKRIDEITKEIQQLENNINFISNVSEDNPLIKNVRRNIAKHQDHLKIWKSKLAYIRTLDY
ncbi:DUF349 domain-containing protein [Aureivirga marina]|uniref:DUF349 domain-containing protein n=1 Tax=Aureivirga marina TaxID=1182451 RepID=UPI0018C93205|nr:DUF349 domain-containing protein [Aureivirga marina]